ncbi:uncharacterized protein isoform X2 [Danio rerio]|uniref:Uncharacterized protein isoform X2 n=2 Tax=Danio rerio TaxID=7955 RepID=A0AC58H777_DANRE
MESPVKNSSTEEPKSLHKQEKQSFLQRTQKVMRNVFLCCQDTLECFVPSPSKPHYFDLKSSETHWEETTPHLDTTCISEHAVESLCVQDLWERSNGILGCSNLLLPGEVPVEPTDAQDLHKTSPNITTVDVTSIAEETVEKKSSTKELDTLGCFGGVSQETVSSTSIM